MTDQATLKELSHKAQTLVLKYYYEEDEVFDLNYALCKLVEDLEEFERLSILNYAVYALISLAPISEYEFAEYGSIEDYSSIDHVVNGIADSMKGLIHDNFALALNVDPKDEIMHVIQEIALNDFVDSPSDYKKENLAKLIAQLQKVHDSL